MKFRPPRFHVSAMVLAAQPLLFLASGCMSADLDQNRDFSAGIQQKDIPVPLNFEFDKDRSFSFIRYNSGEGSFRSWSGFYYGDQQVGNLIPWYQKQMVVDGWALKGETSDLRRKGLTFVKGDETATVWVYREFDARIDRYQTVVNAEIHPTPTEDKTPDEVLASLAPAPLSVGAPPASSSPDKDSSPGAARAGLRKGEEPPASPRRIPLKTNPPTPRKAGAGNKPVVNEEAGDENNEEPPAGDDATPVDGE